MERRVQTFHIVQYFRVLRQLIHKFRVEEKPFLARQKSLLFKKAQNIPFHKFSTISTKNLFALKFDPKYNFELPTSQL
jgi:hypothetical protein